MNKKDAKEKISDATKNGAYAKRARDNSSVELDDEEIDGAEGVPALNELVEEKEVEQLPTAGQARSTVDYKATKPRPKKK